MPFLEFPQELHHIVYRINAIELLNVRLRSVRHRGHFPTDQVALKVVCLTAIAQRPNPLRRATLAGQVRRCFDSLPTAAYCTSANVE